MGRRFIYHPAERPAAWLRVPGRITPAATAVQTGASQRYKLIRRNVQVPWGDLLRTRFQDLRHSTTGVLILDALTSRLSFNTAKTYKSAWKRFLDWCDRTDTPPFACQPLDICHYLAHLASDGNDESTDVLTGAVRLDSSTPYTSTINTAYTDLGLEPPAKGPLVAAVRQGLARMQQDQRPAPNELPLPADIALAILCAAITQARVIDEDPEYLNLDDLVQLQALLAVALMFLTVSRPVSIAALHPTSVETATDAGGNTAFTVTRYYTKTTQTDVREVAGRHPLLYPKDQFNRVRHAPHTQQAFLF